MDWGFYMDSSRIDGEIDASVQTIQHEDAENMGRAWVENTHKVTYTSKNSSLVSNIGCSPSKVSKDPPTTLFNFRKNTFPKSKWSPTLEVCHLLRRH